MRKTTLSILVILFSLVCFIENGYATIVWEETVTETGEVISLVPEGFSKFPEGIEVDASSSKIIEGSFSQRFKSGLKEVVFKVSGIDDSWYELDPTEVDFMEYNTEVPIEITLNIPEEAETDTYDIQLSVESKNVELDWTRDIKLKVESIITTTTTTTILEENITEEKTIPIGTFTLPSVIVNYWHYIFLIVVVIVVILFIWMLYPKKTFESTEFIPEAEPKVMEKKELQKPEEIEKILTEMTPRERLKVSREKRIKEIRERALEMDRKLKGKEKRS